MSLAVVRLVTSQTSHLQEFSLLATELCCAQRYLENFCYSFWFYGIFISMVFRSVREGFKVEKVKFLGGGGPKRPNFPRLFKNV